jgi:hypothetical protein
VKQVASREIGQPKFGSYSKEEGNASRSNFSLARPLDKINNGGEKCYFAFPSCFLYNPKLRQVEFSAYYLIKDSFLLGLFFDPEDRGDKLIRNVG